MVGDRIAWRRKENGRGTARVESNNWLWLKEVRLRKPHVAVVAGPLFHRGVLGVWPIFEPWP